MVYNGKNVQGTHSTRMGADSLAENTTNAPKLIRPTWDFDEKRLHLVSVVRA